MTFNSSKLPNGLTVLTYNIPTLKSVAINLIVKVGSRFETLDEIGISHFFEHMAFKGTPTRSAKDIAVEFDSIGGHFNAYTGREQTVYYAQVLGDNFYKALEILADIIQNSIFDEQDIDKEFKVILQEIAGVYDNPDELVHEKFYNTAYTNQALGRSILGTEETLSKFNSNSFRDFLNKHYIPENMYLSIAGNIEHETAIAAAAKLFSSLQNQQRQKFESAKYKGGYNFINKDLEQTTFVLGFESVPYTNLQEFYHGQILSLIFGGSISSRLFQHIRENLGLAYSVGTYNSAYYDTGLFSIYASTKHEKLLLLIDNLANEIKNVCREVTQSELSRAKEQIKTSIYMSEEKSAHKSEEIGKIFAILGKYYPAEDILKQILEISPEDMVNISKKIFTSKPTLSIIGNSEFKEESYLELCQNLKL